MYKLPSDGGILNRLGILDRARLLAAICTTAVWLPWAQAYGQAPGGPVSATVEARSAASEPANTVQPATAAPGTTVPAAASTSGTSAPGEGALIDRVVAVVQIRSGVGSRRMPNSAIQALPPEVITLSALEFEARVALVQRGAVRAAVEPLDDDALRSALENSINERLLVGEAEVLEAWRVEPNEVETALRVFRDRFASQAEFDAFLKRHEADLQALGRLLERSLRAAKVVDSRVRLRAQVTESEVRRYYDEHQSEIPGSFEDVRGALREKLFRQRYQELVRGEVDQLRRTHDVRRVAPFARAQAAKEEG